MGASQEIRYIRNHRGKSYLVTRMHQGKTRKEIWTPLIGIDQKILEAALEAKESVENEIVEYPCTNPRCRNTVKTTRKQVEEFYLSSKKRYNIVIFPFCSTECRNQILADQEGAAPGSD